MFTPRKAEKAVVRGMRREGITVKCSIVSSGEIEGYDYHVTHMKGFTSSEDFTFACMGTVAVNSANIGFKANWLYMRFDDSLWRIEIYKCQKLWQETEDENLTESDLLNMLDKIRKEIEQIK